MGPILSSVVERCPLYGGVTFCHSVFWDENICPLFGGVRCIEMSVNGDSTVFIHISYSILLKRAALQQIDFQGALRKNVTYNII